MTDEFKRPGFDPYRPLAESLKSGDVINRWLLRGVRKKIAGLLKGQRVLDVCCGTGNLSALLAEAGCQVTGVDSSPTMLSHAHRKGLPVKFLEMDAVNLPFQAEFDAAVISLALHEMPPGVRAAVWAGMRRSVRPGGRLLALDYAVPLKDTFLARFSSGLARRDEREFLQIHPQHFHNYQEFMQNGGLLGWVQKQGQPVEADHRFWAGSLAVIQTAAS